MRTAAARFAPALAAALAVAGCGPNDEQTMGASCDEVETALAFDEVGPLGFSAAQILGDLVFDDGTPEQAYLFWADGGAGHLDISLSYEGGAAAHVDSEIPPEDGGTEAALFCEDYLKVEARLSITSDDGRLDEDWDVVVTATSPYGADLHHEVALDGLDGTLDAAAFLDGVAYDSASLQFRNRFSVVEGDVADLFATSVGELDVFYEVVDDSGPDGTAQAGILPIASWGQDLFALDEAH